MRPAADDWEELIRILDALEDIGLASQADTALAIAHWFDSRGKPEVSRDEFEDAFVHGRRRAPSRIKRVLDRLCAEGLLVENSKAATWLISGKGRKALRQRLWQAGFYFDGQPNHSRSVVASIRDPDVREYLEEATRCLLPPTCAYRAAVLLGWSAVVCHLRKQVQNLGLDNFNRAYATRYPSSKKRASHPDDLQDFRDSELIETCEALRLYDRAVKKRLVHWLDLRNAAAHPTGVRPGIKVVEAFFEEIVGDLLARH